MKKLERITQKIEYYQDDSSKIYYQSILDELEHLAEFKRHSQIWMVFYQFSHDKTDTVPCSSLKEIFDQFQQPKTKEEMEEIYKYYEIDDTIQIPLIKFKEIIRNEIYNKEVLNTI